MPPQLFPAALQQLSRGIVQSRARSTGIAVFTILLVFIAAFVNMVGSWGAGRAPGGLWGAVGHQLTPLAPQFSCSRVALRDCAARELNVTPGAVGPCQLRALNFSLGTPAGSCHGDGLACDFPEVSGRGHCLAQGMGSGPYRGLCWGQVLPGHRQRVLEVAGRWQRVPMGVVSPGMLAWISVGIVSPRVLARGPHGCSVLQGAGRGSPWVQCPPRCWHNVPKCAGTGSQRGQGAGMGSLQALHP